MDLIEFERARLLDRQRDAAFIHYASACDKVIHAHTDSGFGWECDCSEPTWVLYDVEAKLRLIGLHPPNPPGSIQGDFCQTCDVAGGPYPCDTLRLLALPDAGHPDYRAEWGVGLTKTTLNSFAPNTKDGRGELRGVEGL